MRAPRFLSTILLPSLLAVTAALSGASLLRAQSMDAAATPAQQSDEREFEVNRRARALTDELMSPWCKGVTITQCSSGIAEGYRQQVRTWLRDGMSEEEIKRGFAQQFGENYLSMPKGPVSSLVPILILVFGAGVLAVLVRRLQMPSPEASSAEALSAEQYRKLESELDSELRRRAK